MLSGTKNISYIAGLGVMNRSDAWKYFAENTPGFMGGGREAAVVGDKGQIQLWNPAASGKTLYVLNIHVSAPATGTKRVALLHHTAALPTVGAVASNKLIGGTAPVGLIRTHDGGSLTGTVFAETYLGANGLAWRANKSPYRIPEGYGLIVTIVDEEEDFGVLFDWLEL